MADGNNDRLQKFTASGQFLSEVGKKGDGPREIVSTL